MIVPVRYLHVTLDLPDNGSAPQEFQGYMREILPTFTAKPWPNWELFVAAKHMPGRDPRSQADNPATVEYLHVWRVRDYNTLPYLMELFDDDETYRKLDDLVQTEIQDFLQALPYSPASLDPQFVIPAQTTSYLHMTVDLVADPEIVATFNEFMARCVGGKDSPLHRQFGWTGILASRCQTGPLRRHVFIWATDRSTVDPADTITWLTSQPAVRVGIDTSIIDNPQWAHLAPVIYGN